MIVTGILALATGIAYTALGVITFVELIQHRRDRGFSHFGLSFGVMAFTCGPHHLVHAYRHLLGGEHPHGPMTAALALGVAPALVFIGLRCEAAFGGRGDRLIPGTPLFIHTMPLLASAVAGVTIYEAMRHALAMPWHPATLVPNVFLFVNYTFVGLFTWRTQIARRPLLGGWSLSGLAMSGVFVTCGGSHLVAGLLTAPDGLGLALDNIGVPASFYFLWAVHRLHRASARDWNRRPLVGRATPAGRRSPWAQQAV
jgi:hypothetical protein